MWANDTTTVLPTRQNREAGSAIPPKDVTIICLRLKHQIEQVIPCELDEERVTRAHSDIITKSVIATAKSAGGKDHGAAVVYCLLICKKWFKRQALLELWDADLHHVRAEACEVIAKQIIEGEEDLDYLMEDVLLKRYAIIVDNDTTTPANAVEKAVDLHALRVIGSSGYQKTISYLYRGWVMQDPSDPARFVQFEDRSNTSYWSHLDPDRMRVPVYQNAVQIFISMVYLALYTGAINTINPSGDLDFIEGLLYIFTLGFMCDEFGKLFKIGRAYIQFWNIFNSTLYALLVVSFALRIVALANGRDSDARSNFNTLSYNFLACCAPLFWGRLLLYLDTVRFVGGELNWLTSWTFYAKLFSSYDHCCVTNDARKFNILCTVDCHFAWIPSGLCRVGSSRSAAGFCQVCDHTNDKCHHDKSRFRQLRQLCCKSNLDNHLFSLTSGSHHLVWFYTTFTHL